MSLASALGAERGVVCAVGAGGKKTTLYTLAGQVDRAVVTATVRIPLFDPHVAELHVTDDPVAAIEGADRWPVGVVPAREGEDRYLGYDPEVVCELARAGTAGTLLVKADGARMREFKAPGEREPQVPPCADTVLPIVSAHVVGKPLTAEHVHRVERVAGITGRDPGEPIRPEDVAAVLASPQGALRGVPGGATVVPVVNKVDDADLETVGREIASAALDRADLPRVVLARMAAAEPLVAVVEP